MIAGLIYIIFGLLELLLALRFVFLLIGANPTSEFVAWVYSWSAPFVAPFANIFGQHVTTSGTGVVVQSVFDWNTLIALIIYAVVGGLAVRLLAQF